MECNRDEAVRAKIIAEEKVQKNDFLGARKFALKAETLYPGLDGISQMLAMLDVHIKAERKILYIDATNKICSEVNWYSVLDVDPSADEATIKKQYRKLALLLHPDKNSSAGAESAFKLIQEGWTLLSNQEARAAYDRRLATDIKQKAQMDNAGPSAAPSWGSQFSRDTGSSSGLSRENQFHTGSPSGQSRENQYHAGGSSGPSVYRPTASRPSSWEEYPFSRPAAGSSGPSMGFDFFQHPGSSSGPSRDYQFFGNAGGSSSMPSRENEFSGAAGSSSVPPREYDFFGRAGGPSASSRETENQTFGNTGGPSAPSWESHFSAGGPSTWENQTFRHTGGPSASSSDSQSSGHVDPSIAEAEKALEDLLRRVNSILRKSSAPKTTSAPGRPPAPKRTKAPRSQTKGANFPFTSTPTPASQSSNSFWTICWRCQKRYEYYRKYLNVTINCKTCYSTFEAREAPLRGFFGGPRQQQRNQRRNAAAAQRSGAGQAGPSSSTNAAASRRSGEGQAGPSSSGADPAKGADVFQRDKGKTKLVEEMAEGNRGSEAASTSGSRTYEFPQPNSSNREMMRTEAGDMLAGNAQRQILNWLRSEEEEAEANEDVQDRANAE